MNARRKMKIWRVTRKHEKKKKKKKRRTATKRREERCERKLDSFKNA
jgi:hypothetical protein